MKEYKKYKLTAAGNPTQAAMNDFLRIIKPVFVNSNGISCDMRKIGLPENPTCGSVACFGGAICVAFDIRGEYTYLEGANVMADMLGFSKDVFDLGVFYLMKWAKDNPSIWGNHYGADMFRNALAFGSTEEQITLKHIFNYLLKVEQRLPKCEYKGITILEGGKQSSLVSVGINTKKPTKIRRVK